MIAWQVMTQTVQPQPGDDKVLAGYRKSIDNIDAAIVHMLAERFRITQAVGEYKAKVTLPPADPNREKEQIARLRRLAPQEARLRALERILKIDSGENGDDTGEPDLA